MLSILVPVRLTRWLLRVGLVLGGLVFAGCRPSQHPLIDPDQAVIDERLIGIWVAESTPDSPNGFPQGVPSAPSDGVMVLTIGRPSRDELGLNIPDGVLAAKWLWFSPKEELMDLREAKYLGIIAAEIGAGSYASVFDLNDCFEEFRRDNKTVRIWRIPSPEEAHYCLFRYDCDGDTLLLFPQSGVAAAKLIKEGKLTGEVRGPGEDFVFGELAESTDGLRRFIANGGGDELFSENVPKNEVGGARKNQTRFRRIYSPPAGK
jgi:hypothetical protein